METILSVIVLGLGATVVMDVWALFQVKCLRIPSLDYALVGRWLLYLPTGTFQHQIIMSTQPITGEKILGWVAHYAIGVCFAFVHIGVLGVAWLQSPTIGTALMTGWVTLVFPFLLMQPCFGFGVAASKAPNPWKARLLSSVAHSMFGLGLFIVAVVL